jgi:serine/threonine-protein kinase
MGVVLHATDELFSREVAVKLLLTEPGRSPHLVERFEYEAKVTARLQHLAVPPVHDRGVLPDGRPYLIMKLIQGKTLAHFLRLRESPSDEHPKWISVLEQVAQTVSYAHSRRVIHRDLKPLNIMVGAFGEVQVMDWGLAKELGVEETDPIGHSSTSSSNSMGTRALETARTPSTSGFGAPLLA